MLNLIKKLAIQDSSNLANIIQLDNIMSGVDGASTFGYSLTPTAVQVNDNQRQQYKFTHQFDVRTLDPTSADREKLSVIESNSSTCNVAGISENGFVALRGKLTRNDQYDEVISDRFLLTTDTVAGYVSGYYSGDNILADSDILNPVSFTTPTLTGTASGRELTLTRISGSTNYGFGFRFFPFVGETLFYTVNITGLASTSGNSILSIVFRDSSNSDISSASSIISTTGLITLSAIVPSNTVYFQCLIRPAGGIGDTVTFKEPILSLGTTVFTL